MFMLLMNIYSSYFHNCQKLEVTDPWVGKISCRRKQQPTPVSLPGKSHGQRNLVGYSSWGCKESDTTERLHFHFFKISFSRQMDEETLVHTDGEGNGTPLQYSCLENPMDGKAWQAAVHGVVKSRTRLSDFTFTFRFHALEKEMATHSSILAWRISGTAKPGGLPSMGSHRVGHN